MPNENEGLCKLDKSRLCKSIKMTLQIIPENFIISTKDHKRVSINIISYKDVSCKYLIYNSYIAIIPIMDFVLEPAFQYCITYFVT